MSESNASIEGGADQHETVEELVGGEEHEVTEVSADLASTFFLIIIWIACYIFN